VNETQRRLAILGGKRIMADLVEDETHTDEIEAEAESLIAEIFPDLVKIGLDTILTEATRGGMK